MVNFTCYYKNVGQCISCTNIKPNNIINTKCYLYFCDECTKHIIPDEELDDGPNTSFINLGVYKHQLICAKHGIIINWPDLCKPREENYDTKNGIIKSPT